MTSLWGDDFEIKDMVKESKKIISKINQPKEVKKDSSIRATLKSKKLSIEDKLNIINENVNKTLGVYKSSTVVIKTREQLISYIDKAITNKIIAIDTETNNSLDPITCKLMGPCIYTPGMDSAYIPINHKDYETDERLPWQLTEQDILEQFSRLDTVTILMHNGKFDYEVIKCTTGLELHIDWDTMIGAKLLDENERSAGLKQQYIDKIDPSIEKYSIDELFEDIEYAYVDPDVFALYAATDAWMTYKLYEWQMDRFKDPSLARVLNLAKTVEMPLIPVVAEMELAGVDFDKEYDERLSEKYHKKLDILDEKITDELNKLQPLISSWRLSDDANFKPPKKSGQGEGKSKSEQLSDPVNVASPTQLAILLYDILKIGVIDKKNPRGTGEDILEKINQPIAKLLLERRGLMKLITAFIDSLPGWVNPKTGRIHCHFNAYGAATGRFSSSEPNLQQIPSHNYELRLLFRAGTEYQTLDYADNYFECNRAAAILSGNRYIKVTDLKIGDCIDIENEDGSQCKEFITNIKLDDIKCCVWTEVKPINEKIN